MPRVLYILALTLPAAPAAAANVTVTVRSPDGRPVENAVVSIESTATRPGTPPAFHYPPRVSQKDIQFHPFVLLVPKGATVSFPNFDRVRHHVYSFSSAKRFELKLYGQEEDRSVTFDQPGAVALGCNIHDQMTAFIMVVETPWAERTDAAGRVTIRGVPNGPATLRVWHPQAVAKGNELAMQLPLSGDVARAVELKIGAR